MAVFNLVENEDNRKSIAVFVDGRVLLTDDTHPRFDQIVQRVLADDLEGIADLFSPETTIKKQFAKLSADVRIENGVVFYRNEPMSGTLVEQIMQRYDADEEYGSFVRFLERLQANPNPHSVEHLYRWIADRQLTLTSDGRIVGYKGLRSDSASIHSVPAIRNGEDVRGHIQNDSGDVIEMSRDDVTFDSGIGCAQGLHVGTWSYARGFGSVVREVFVDPADVVSVPTDCADEKMRVCRYVVGKKVTSQHKALTVDVGGQVFATPAADYPYTVNNDAVDTTQNHLKQKRDAFGRFVKS